MIDWNDYSLVLEIARQGTLRKAGAALGVNHTTLSRRLEGLERKLDAPVFDRVVGGYAPNALGQQLLEIAEQMERAAKTLERRRRSTLMELAGPIALSIPEVLGQYLLAEDIVTFAASHPQIELTVHSSTSFVDLDRSEADVVIRGTNAPPDHLVGRRLFPYALSFYARKGYLDETPPSERRWIAAPTRESQPAWLPRSPFPDAPIGLRMHDAALRHRAAVAGFGMSVGACYMADPEPMLERLPGAVVFHLHDLWVLTHPDLKNTPRIRLLMQYLSDCLKRRQIILEGNALTTT